MPPPSAFVPEAWALALMGPSFSWFIGLTAFFSLVFCKTLLFHP
jgi:hypothetical protein